MRPAETAIVSGLSFSLLTADFRAFGPRKPPRSAPKVKSLRGARGGQDFRLRFCFKNWAKRPFEQPGHDRRNRTESSTQQEELSLVHLTEEASDVTLQLIAGETGDEPQSHHHRQDLWGRNARDERQSDRRKIELSKRDDDEEREE